MGHGTLNLFEDLKSVVANNEHSTITFGHDGPFHIANDEGKPILRG